ncbi:hypothetical protein BK675_10890 [Pseudomonas fluorescens]|nr:hypothetical protein BK677_01540 [Pseudomonas fluorescens]ROO08487.1 hypothetical protein BK675_10890 [Pseudomonas fluorescens]ROO16815.1 hypothetical protein BK676_14275 [Pseudomonas fluorescens]
MFNPTEVQYANGIVVVLPYSTEDVRVLTQAACAAVERVYRIGFNYSKAEVILLNLCQQGNSPGICLPGRSGEATKVLSVLDAINDRCGRGTLRWRVFLLRLIGPCDAR